jgi:hypothetical protein
MKKLLLTILLTVISTSAMAEWTFLTTNADITKKVYIDVSSIRKNKSQVKMWDLFDFKNPLTNADGSRCLSAKRLVEYDCNNEQSRLLAFVQHSSNMGKGEVVMSYAVPDDWFPVAPNTIEQSLIQATCRKK